MTFFKIVLPEYTHIQIKTAFGNMQYIVCILCTGYFERKTTA